MAGSNSPSATDKLAKPLAGHVTESHRSRRPSPKAAGPNRGAANTIRVLLFATQRDEAVRGPDLHFVHFCVGPRLERLADRM